MRLKGDPAQLLSSRKLCFITPIVYIPLGTLFNKIKSSNYLQIAIVFGLQTL